MLDITKLLLLFICMFCLQGYKMDDLLTSYISLMLTTMNKNRTMRRQWATTLAAPEALWDWTGASAESVNDCK